MINFTCGTKPVSRAGKIAPSCPLGSQSRREFRFILPAHGARHIISIYIVHGEPTYFYLQLYVLCSIRKRRFLTRTTTTTIITMSICQYLSILLVHLLLHAHYTKYQVWNKRVVGFPRLLTFRTSFDGFFKPSITL